MPSTCIVVWRGVAPCTDMRTCSIICAPPTSGRVNRTPCAR